MVHVKKLKEIKCLVAGKTFSGQNVQQAIYTAGKMFSR
jgi:hypothetical protein